MREQIARIICLYGMATGACRDEDVDALLDVAVDAIMHETQQPMESGDYVFFTKSQAKDYVSNHRLEFFANCMRNMATNPNISAAEVDAMLWMAQHELKQEEEK